jgi:hydrophobic/amphiphilic exporter-1 (mainly G- bacteria), HAE1 family
LSRLYSSPLRVYLLLGALAAVGFFSGLKLPISLFPNSSKPSVVVNIPYGNYTADEFLRSYGEKFEDQLKKISFNKLEVEKLRADYRRRNVQFTVEFKWGASPTDANREVRYIANSFASRLPTESRDGMQIWTNNENSGFFAVSFFSETRDLDNLYDLLDPILAPRVQKVEDASEPVLYNPFEKEVRITLNPDAMATLQLFPRDIEQAIEQVIGSQSGGSIMVGTKQLQIEMPRLPAKFDDLALVSITTPSGKTVHLGDVARIDLGPKTADTQSFKTNGAASLILFATPRPGGNVKRMSEEILQIVKEVMPTLPPDVQYRVLVDPSEFIRSAVNNVIHEVGIAALLAVCVLFVFIGSFRNVITAAIEIPLSMVLAFILMRLSGMNLNMISLGGLALSAGMNVDASVVVMENIFRHFEMNPGPHTPQARIKILTEAVKEVQFPIIASTIASLVVFLPLTFTSALSYAILGDLAYAVVFSHGFSAVVALLLVPTVRLQLMSRGKGEVPKVSFIEPQLKRLEFWYSNALGKFLARPKLKWATYGGLSLALILLTLLVLPRLPREIVGTPDTDWMTLQIRTEGNTLLKQMEIQADEVEKDLLTLLGSKIQYTFTNIEHPNQAEVMARLKDKGEMKEVWKTLEKRFVNTPLLRFQVFPWNPSELPIPNPPALRISVRGSDVALRTQVARDLNDFLEEKKFYPRLSTKPNVKADQGVSIVPHLEQWEALGQKGIKFRPQDLIDLVRVGTTGRRVAQFAIKNRLTDVMLKYPPQSIRHVEDVADLPIGVGGKVVPLKSLSEVISLRAAPSIYREDGQDLVLLEGRLNEADKPKTQELLAKAKEAVGEWKKTALVANEAQPTVLFERADKDLEEAISQLSYAVVFSILLIFLVLLIQFGSFAEPLLVLVSVPLGFLGVLTSLFIFRSTLSLNSILGVILLNGIAVANSIILVDFIKRLVDRGNTPREAAIEAAKKRLRPILITSLTTVLGMLPVALGLGEGGRILQPLGIAVSGGLWVSTTLTLFLVPALQVSYLEWRSTSHPWFRPLGRKLKSFVVLEKSRWGKSSPIPTREGTPSLSEEPL